MIIAFCIGFVAGVISTVVLLLVVVIAGDRMEAAEKGERSRLMSWPFRRKNVLPFKRQDKDVA